MDLGNSILIGLYFSGTGNSKYCIEKFLHQYDKTAKAYPIEDISSFNEINEHEIIVMAYPVQYSNIPKILSDFIENHKTLWQGKQIFIIATMALFSGDGTGVLARKLKKYGAQIIGGIHITMPDSIADEKVLKRSFKQNKKLISRADEKIKKAVEKIKNNKPPQEGIGLFCQLAGLLGQRLYFYHKTKEYSDKLKIDSEKCIGCGKCVKLCPMKNLELKNKTLISKNKCTLCYRCINDCPKQALTLLGKQVISQHKIDKYL